jgi:hypothetical protein
MPQVQAYRVELHASGIKEVHYAYGPREIRSLFERALTLNYTYLKISVLYESSTLENPRVKVPAH